MKKIKNKNEKKKEHRIVKKWRWAKLKALADDPQRIKLNSFSQTVKIDTCF